MKIDSYSYLGINVYGFKENDLQSMVKHTIHNHFQVMIGYHNLHSVYLTNTNETMKQFYNSCDYTHIDGMPVVWLGKLLGYPLTSENRLTSLDWLPRLLKDWEKENYRVFLLGSKPGVAEKTKDKFKQWVPHLEIETHHGYFDIDPTSQEGKQVIEKMNHFNPHIVLVGMGMPRQETWSLLNRKHLSANIVWNLGAFMDYYAGIVPTPPRWMGRLGLEWLYRLFSEPNRLWRRYLIEPWFILRLFIKEYIRNLQKRGK